ncbi:NACHT domain-containing protein [Kribbella kalugense]|uniref:NACHT domain-containing protein n=1 Tax=Kribbella kalugense TaxID=2512221 RepID=A0A4R7ZWK5_9ACTN|nr:large ATP-binding protein [Kribbella kalugense]TDW22125.1 hypothetical protein EV650_0958 [Kribbella kalugense]
MPESRYRYLYERLGDHSFQLLVSALLTDRFTDFVPLPLRQADGGRDGVTRGSDRALVYQVKWSVNGKEKDAVRWLDATIELEAENLRRLAREGAQRYVLVTNIPSTGKAGSGTFDALNKRLDAHARAYGFEEMSCLWREAVDGMVDNAPKELLWKYADMLAGWELVRYLIAEDGADQHDAGLRKLIRAVASVQWDEDERVKFSQVDIDREKVSALFVDVDADLLIARDPREPENLTRKPLGGAAAHLLSHAGGGHPFTLVRGAPGQGKSTLAQFLCQTHRSAFVAADLRPVNLPKVKHPLFPLRVELSDYGRWLTGLDVWDAESDVQKKAKRRPQAEATIECFIADLMSNACGGTRVTANEVQDLFGLVPSLVVLDGLDEVGRPAMRARIVTEIERFARRNRTYDIPPQVIVTTRPSANQLAEPTPDLFSVVVLSPFTPSQREDYLRKWSAVRGIRGADGRSLRSTFRAKIAEPYLDELASNPMQLAILLDLLHKHGEAIPTQRTALYDSYVDLLLAREANKHPESVRKHQAQLREIIPFLGWHLHAHAEADSVNARMKIADLKATIKHFQETYGNPGSIVDELFEAASDRLWTLTSKIEGTYEFEVLSLREYFAARFLYRYAGEETKRFDRVKVFRELLRRPYWLNTTRFYGGNAEAGDLSVLADGIAAEIADNPGGYAVIAGWTLLTDGVFTSRPRWGRDVVFNLCDEEQLSTLANAWSRREIYSLPRLPEPVGGGPDPTWARYTSAIAADPGDDRNYTRVWLLRDLLSQRREFAAWWCERIRDAASDPEAVDHWLKMAADCEGAAGQSIDLNAIDLLRPLVAQRVLNTGLTPPPGSSFEADLIAAVLEGHCPNVQSTRSLPAQIAVAFEAESYFAESEAGFNDNANRRRRRQDALRHLRRNRPELAKAAELRRFRVGEKGSTFPWTNTATALFDSVGPCWLASQIAILGAASPFRLASKLGPDGTPFGGTGHPATLANQSRVNAASGEWWRLELAQLTEVGKKSAIAGERAHAEWALALWCVADPNVVLDLFEDWEKVMLELPEPHRRPVVDAAQRCSLHGWVAALPSAPASEDSTIAALIDSRQLTWHAGPIGSGKSRRPVQQRPLIEVARDRRWFKVDETGAYR